MAQGNTHTKSSTEEDTRYIYLVSLEQSKAIKDLRRQVTLKPLINGIEVFEYTPDFLYKELVGDIYVPIAEEYKGYEFQRHDFRLRMRICSAIYPDVIFRIVTKKGLSTQYKAGVVHTRKKKKGRPTLK